MGTWRVKRGRKTRSPIRGVETEKTKEYNKGVKGIVKGL